MEIEILVAVVATGLGLIGGMLVIWTDYRGPRQKDRLQGSPRTPNGSTGTPSQEQVLFGDQN